MSDVTTKPIDGLESDPLAVWMSDLREDVVTDFSDSEVAKITAGASSAIAVGALGGVWAIVSGWSFTAKILGTMGAVAIVAGAGAATGTLPGGIQSAIADGAAVIGIQIPNPSDTDTTSTAVDSGAGTDVPTDPGDSGPGVSVPGISVPGVDDIIEEVVVPLVPDADIDVGVDLSEVGIDLGVDVDDLDIGVDAGVSVPGAGVDADVDATVDLLGIIGGDDDPGEIDVSVDATVPLLPDVDLDAEVTVPTLPLPDVEIPIVPIDSTPTVTLPDLGGLLFP